MPEPVIKQLNLVTAATHVTSGNLDRLPPLVMDRCLADSTADLAELVESVARAGHAVQTETITLPRRGFVPRPVAVVSPEVRVAYVALVQALSPSLPPQGRSTEAHERHGRFGVPNGDSPWHEYLVETDVASCYEYIDHGRLREELIVQSMNVGVASQLVQLLGEIHGMNRGLPQLMAASDALADTYLQIMERSLLRRRLQVSRYADDFKILASDWGGATQIIEDAAEAAREIGLVLSTEKTSVRKASTVLAAVREESEFLKTYLDEAQGQTEIAEMIQDFYGNGEGALSPDSGVDAVRVAMRRLLMDWHRDQSGGHRHFPRYLPLALAVLQSSEIRIEDQVLVDIVFRHPLFLQNVISYVRSRAELDNWATLAKLVAMRRQSPWAKIWLLHAADTLPADSVTCWVQDVDSWAIRQLSDPHEVVRAEAAWYLGGRPNGALTDETLSALYREGRSLTRPSLAAACGRMNFPNSASLVRAISQDSKLVRQAFQWGEMQHAAT